VRARKWLGRAFDWFVPRENPAAMVYGVIAIGALLAAETGLHDGYREALLSALVAAVIYWLAYAYAALLGRRLTTDEQLTAKALGRPLVHDWGIIRGAAIPLGVLVAAWAAGAAKETGVTIALWCTVGTVIVLELAAGMRSTATRGGRALDLAVGVLLGLGIVLLRTVLHK